MVLQASLQFFLKGPDSKPRHSMQFLKTQLHVLVQNSKSKVLFFLLLYYTKQWTPRLEEKLSRIKKSLTLWSGTGQCSQDIPGSEDADILLYIHTDCTCRSLCHCKHYCLRYGRPRQRSCTDRQSLQSQNYIHIFHTCIYLFLQIVRTKYFFCSRESVPHDNQEHKEHHQQETKPLLMPVGSPHKAQPDWKPTHTFHSTVWLLLNRKTLGKVVNLFKLPHRHSTFKITSIILFQTKQAKSRIQFVCMDFRSIVE